MKITGCCGGAFICLHASFCSLSDPRGSAPTADQSHFASTVHEDARGMPRQKAHPKSLQILFMQSKQDAQQCELPQEPDIAQPLCSGREGSFTTRTLIVSALVMSARSAANSFMPPSSNSPFHSECQSCQQINPSTTRSSLSQPNRQDQDIAC